MKPLKQLFAMVSVLSLVASAAFAQANPKLAGYKTEAVKGVDEMAKLAQEMVDSVFSFGELGLQEVETSTLPDRRSSRSSASRCSAAWPAFPPRGSRSGARASR